MPPKATGSPKPGSSPSPPPGGIQSGKASQSIATEGAGVFLALVLYPVVVNFLNGGPKQVAGWIRAKWINEPYAAASSKGAPVVNLAPTPSGYDTTPKPIYQR